MDPDKLYENWDHPRQLNPELTERVKQAVKLKRAGLSTSEIGQALGGPKNPNEPASVPYVNFLLKRFERDHRDYKNFLRRERRRLRKERAGNQSW